MSVLTLAVAENPVKVTVALASVVLDPRIPTATLGASNYGNVTVGKNATVGAGTVLTRDAEAGELVVARAKQRHITDWQRPVKIKK